MHISTVHYCPNDVDSPREVASRRQTRRVKRMIGVISSAAVFCGITSSCSQFQQPPSTPKGPPRYTVTDVGSIAFDLGDSINRYVCMNNDSEVTGTYSVTKALRVTVNGATGSTKRHLLRSFIWRDGKQSLLPGLPNYLESRTLGLNDSGDVAGYAMQATGGNAPICAFVIASGHIAAIAPPKNGPGRLAVSINDKGAVLLQSRTDSYLIEGGVERDLNVRGAIQVNNSDQVIGTGPYGTGGQFQAFLYQAGKTHSLGTLPEAMRSTAEYMNNRGQVVGYAGLNNRSHAVVWNNGKITDIGGLTGSDDSVALGINNLGEIVGFAGGPEIFGADARAFLWENGVAQNLNNLIPAGSGWLLISAGAINDHGQIAGFGYLNGKEQVYLLTPN